MYNKKLKYSVDKNGCWIGKGELLENGYIRVRVSGKRVRLHRYSYSLHKGEIPQLMEVMHKCDNRQCVNPDHLILGSHDDNMKDMVSKKRQACGERMNCNKLTKEDVLQIRSEHENKTRTRKQLASAFGVNYDAISKVVNRSTWKHI